MTVGTTDGEKSVIGSGTGITTKDGGRTKGRTDENDVGKPRAVSAKKGGALRKIPLFNQTSFIFGLDQFCLHILD